MPHQCAFTYFTYPFYCKLLSFFIAIHKKKHISLYLQFTVKLLAQFPILEFYFLTLACYFVGMKEFFSPAIHLTARTFQLMSGAEGHVHKDQQLQPLRAPGTPSDSRPRSIGSPARWRACFKAVQSFTDEQCYLLVPLHHSFVTTVLM